MTGPRLSLADMARRVARDIPSGAYVNLGIGMPTLVGEVASPEKEIVYHSENGILGMGPAPAPGEGDPELINAGKQPVTLVHHRRLSRRNPELRLVETDHPVVQPRRHRTAQRTDLDLDPGLLLAKPVPATDPSLADR